MITVEIISIVLVGISSLSLIGVCVGVVFEWDKMISICGAISFISVVLIILILLWGTMYEMINEGVINYDRQRD